MSSNACLKPDCNGNGRCTIEGKCQCQNGWIGEFCEQRDCLDPKKCAKHGVCLNGQCYCKNGWFGESCELEFNSFKLPSSNSSLKNNSCSSTKQCLNGEICDMGECKCLIGWNCSIHDNNNNKIFLLNNERKSVCLPGCEQHGICHPNGHCECLKGWSGENCFIGIIFFLYLGFFLILRINTNERFTIQCLLAPIEI